MSEMGMVVEKVKNDAVRKFWARELTLGLLPLLIGFEVLLWTVYLPLGVRGIADFRQFYTGGYMLRSGQANRLYDSDAAISLEETLVPVGAHFMLSVTHPAFEEILFVPFSLLSYHTAYWVFMILNLLLLVVCARLLRYRLATLRARWKWYFPLLLAAYYPVSRCLTQGQDSIVMLTLLAGALVALDSSRDLRSGALLGLGVFKFQIALPIALLFLLWRRWRFCLGFLISASAAVAASLAIVGTDGMARYLRILLSMSSGLASRTDVFRDPMIPTEMLNLRGLISAVFAGVLSPMFVQVLIFVCSAGVLLLTAATRRQSLPLAITAASLVSYHLLAHDATLLVIPISLGIASGDTLLAASAIATFVATIFAVTPPWGYLAAVPLLAFFIASLKPVALHAPKLHQSGTENNTGEPMRL